MNNKEIGNLGEKIAIQYLKNKKYKILETNFSSKKGEIDIVAKDKKELVFIEVKTRRNSKYGKPIEAVNKIKEKHLYKTAEYYLYKKHINNIQTRFDVIEIYIKYKEIKINHIKVSVK